VKAHTKTLEDALQEGVFDIPEYQRSYSWEEEQREEFLQDIRYLPEESSHFFGNIILDEQEERYEADSGITVKAFDVVDGQQRLTTVMIFLHVAAELDDGVAQQLDLINTLSLPEDRLRLLPQDQDRKFFRDHILGDASVSMGTPSQERLQATYEDFHEELARLEEEGQITIQEMAKRLRDNFQLNIVETEGESEAAAIFEGLNDRGKPLSSLEKTKSLLVNMDGRANRNGNASDRIDDRFGDIYRHLFVLSNGHYRAQNFSEDAFQRFHWGVYDGYDSDEYFNSFETLKGRLYEKYRNEDYDGVREEIEKYSLRLWEAADAFEAIFRPQDRPPIVEERLVRLLNLGRIANLLPVLLAAQLEYGDQAPARMASIVEACEILAFRVYSIDRRRSNTGRSRLVNLAYRIRNKSGYGFEDTIQRLKEITQIYADDDRFKSDLESKSFYKDIASRDTRYLLYHYGQNLEIDIPEDTGSPLSNILEGDFQVEHILAKELEEAEIPEDIEDFEEQVHRLGNLTIANGYWNREYGNLPFAQKKQADSQREVAYATSDLRVQRVLADYPEFTKSELEKREHEITRYAMNEWALDYDVEHS